MRFIRRLLRSVGHACTRPTPIYEDNSGALKWATAASSPKWNATRHIATRHFAVREWRTAEIIDILKVPTDSQWADPFTKALPHSQLAAHRTNLLGLRRADAPSYNSDPSLLAHAPPAA